MERDDGVDHRRHGDNGEQGGGNAANTVTKVEQTDGETAENDGKVQP